MIHKDDAVSCHILPHSAHLFLKAETAEADSMTTEVTLRDITLVHAPVSVSTQDAAHLRSAVFLTYVTFHPIAWDYAMSNMKGY